MQFSIQSMTLPPRIIRILNREWRQTRGVTALISRIYRGQFPYQHCHRPSISNNVMEGQPEHMLFILYADQLRPKQRQLGQVERLLYLYLRSLSECIPSFISREIAYIEFGKFNCCVGFDLLDWLSIIQNEARSQNLVAIDDLT